jgi:hypothetical protein
MTVSIGFALLTHENPAQIRRLIDRLNTMFGHPQIVCHHDFTKCNLDIDHFAGNVSFVLPPLQTGWGIFATVEAAVSAIRLLYRSPAAPDWFVLLSGSDYPIKPAARIRFDLEVSSFDAHIHHELIDRDHISHDWQRLCCERYLRGPFSPFSDKFRCYAGEFWFSGNRRAAAHILDFHIKEPTLASYYQNVPIPEESYFQCILANASHLKLSDKLYRYVDWTGPEPRPRRLSISDLPNLFYSDAHFARKFTGDFAILDELDAVIGQ